MQIRSVTIQGFRSFAEEQELNFGQLSPGLYHLAGRNEVEPSLGANGAGKSSLFEAVCWGLYGHTSRNLRASAVKSWNSKEKCAVILEVSTSAGELSIFRVWNPNTLEISVNGGTPRPIEQRELDALLGMSAEAFLFSIYFAQFAPAFIDLRPAEQMEVFSTVLGLDLWEQAADAAGRQARDLQTAVARCREVVAALTGQVQELEALNFDAPEREWLASVASKKAQVQATLDTAAKAIKAAKKERDKHVAGAEEYASRQRLYAECGSQLAVAQAAARRLQQEVDKLSGKAKVTKCPMCGAPITIEHLKKERAKQEALLQEAEAAVRTIGKQHLALADKVAAFADAQRRATEAEKKLSALESDLQNNALALERLSSEVNPFERQRAERDRKLQERRSTLAEQAGQLQEAEIAQAAAEFWSKGFKELRLSLIEESLEQLSIEANSALVELGLADWGLSFDVERETKAGKISKGFTVRVHAPHVQEPMPWEVWSGGESQRLRVATSLGFAELVCARTGTEPNLLLLDEPSTWLSESGIHDLLLSLAERAQRRRKVILLADHRALDFGGFRGVLTVIKTAAGSRLESV